MDGTTQVPGSEGLLDAEKEYDFSADGTQEGEFTFTIQDVNEEDAGKGRQLVLSFVNQQASKFPVEVGYWLSHENPDAVRAGRNQLKRIARAATGSPRFTRSTLIGKTVVATLYEDDNGFNRLKKFKPVAQGASATAAPLA